MSNNKLIPADTPNDGLPSSWTPIDEPSLGIIRNGPQPNPQGPGAYFAASIPAVMQQNFDIPATQYPGGAGGYRIMPVGPSGVASVNSAIKSGAMTAPTPAPTPSPSTTTIGLAGPYNSTTTIASSTISHGSNTSVMSTTAAIPTTGGPFRIFVDYTLFVSSGDSQNGGDTWATDGTNTWAPDEWYFDAGMNGSTNAFKGKGFSPVTYPAGAGTVTITLMATNNRPGGGSTLTAVSPSLAGSQESILEAWVVPSN